MFSVLIAQATASIVHLNCMAECDHTIFALKALIYQRQGANTTFSWQKKTP
jgi:hypothetical protein